MVIRLQLRKPFLGAIFPTSSFPFSAQLIVSSSASA